MIKTIRIHEMQSTAQSPENQTFKSIFSEEAVLSEASSSGVHTL